MEINEETQIITPAPVKTPHKELKRTTFVVLICVLLLLCFMTALSIWRQHQHSIEKIEIEIQTAAERLERWLQYPLRFFDALPLNTLANSADNESRFFDQIISRSDRFYSVKLIDSDGITVRSFGGEVTREPDTTWQNALQTKVGFLQFGQSFFEPTTGSWLMPVRHLQPVGDKHLQAIAYMDGRAFEAIFNSLHPTGEGSLSIFRRDGLMLARIPYSDRLIGKSFASGPLFSKILPTSPNGISHAPKKTDGIERIVAHKSLNAYPLVITVGQNINPVMKKNYQNLFLKNAGFLAVFLFSLVLAYILWQQVKAVEIAQNSLVKTQQELNRLASIDTLTGCFNRRIFLQKAEVERARFQRNGCAFSCIMLDLDHFKKLNDTHGHQVGDDVLVGFANLCRESLRSVDFMGRYGGEEFLILLPETGLGPAIEVADRLRKGLNRNGLKIKDQTLPLTFSAGVASIAHPKETLEELIKRADDALYKAKGNGRNQVVADQTERYV